MTIDQGNLELCAKIVAQTKTLVPVAIKFGGTLRNSYMYKVNTSLGEEEGMFNNYSGQKAANKLKYKPKKNEAVVGSALDYSVYVEFGTRAHIIEIKNAKVLTNGKKFFGKKVKHPGTVAQPHLRPAVDIVMGRSAKSVLKDVANLQMEQSIKLGKKTKNVG